MSGNQANHEHSLSHSSTNGQNSSNVGAPNAGTGDVSMLSNIDSNQIISLLRNIPDFLGKVCDNQYLLLAPFKGPVCVSNHHLK
jgi:hypothetical protein